MSFYCAVCLMPERPVTGRKEDAGMQGHVLVRPGKMLCADCVRAAVCEFARVGRRLRNDFGKKGPA